MNFDKIKKKYPKAWNKFENFAIVNSDLEADTIGYSDNYIDDINRLSLTTLSGYFYYFFDKQGIIIEIAMVELITYSIWEKGYAKEFVFGGIYDFYSRQKAEEAAFTKAFEILEKK